MAANKKKTGKKTTGSSVKKTSRASKKTPKVKLNKKTAFGVAAVIVGVCVAALLFANFVMFGSGGELEEVPQEFLEIPEPELDNGQNEKPVQNLPETKNPQKKDTEKTNEEPVLELIPQEQLDIPENPSQESPSQITPVVEEIIPPLQQETVKIPEAKKGTKICFVIDDGGLNIENVRRYAQLPFPLTVAILPKLAHSKECAQIVTSCGKELILHQPMQAHDYSSGTTPNPGPGAILPEMGSTQITILLNENLSEVGASVRGVNNHEGSLITENKSMMDSVIKAAKGRGLYFLDSRTTSTSSVPEVAKENGVKYIARYAPFLDNVIDKDKMLSELLKGLEVANRDGYAIIIGHVDKSAEILPDLLKEIYPELVKKGYILTTPSELLK